jgi:hypothetical protein
MTGSGAVEHNGHRDSDMDYKAQSNSVLEGMDKYLSISLSTVAHEGD